MSFSSNMRKVTNRLIKKFGDPIVLVETQIGEYDPITGETNDITTNHNIKGVVSGFSSNDIVKDAVNINDLNVMIYADYLEQEFYNSILEWFGYYYMYDSSKKQIRINGWSILYRGSEWKIINVSDLSTQGSLVFYNLQIRSK